MANAYKGAGVDIEAGYEAVSRMKKHVATTMRKEVMSQIGSFGGFFDLSQMNVKEPVLISGTDGVGTKLKLAFMTDKHDTIGIDCVAMCVNDIVAQGAEPMFFLDYIALGKAVPEKIEGIVKGVSEGCVQAGCSLIGGETAEMPGMYDEEEYDLAGFTVGVVEKSKLITGDNINEGDVLIGLPSSGVHSNGYSLVRKIVFTESNLSLEEVYAPFTRKLGEELLEPTKIYVKPVLSVLQVADIKGMAHITGGGFIENIPRALPEGYKAEIKLGSWPILPIFEFLREKGRLNTLEMMNIFNMGIGFVLIASVDQVSTILKELERKGETGYIIGKVTKGEGVSFIEE